VKTMCFASVKRLAKIVSEIIYYVSSGMLIPTQLTHRDFMISIKLLL